MTPSGDKRIVAYVVPHKGHLVPPGHELRRFLENKLPHYMIPPVFVVLNSLPLTPNGKINFDALPAPERVSQNRLDRREPQLSETIVLSENSFAGLWKEMFPDADLTRVDDNASLFRNEDEEKVAVVWAKLLGKSLA